MQITSIRPGAMAGLSRDAAPQDPEPPQGPTLPALNDRIAASLGLEQLVAVLSEQMAKDVRKDAREQQRAARDEQVVATKNQVAELHAKAKAIRNEGTVAATMTIAGGIGQVYGAGAGGGRFAKAVEAGGKSVSDTGSPMAKACYGGVQVDRDADATWAASQAKRAETLADEHGALVRACDATIDKAHQALQALIQGRAQLNATLLRPM